MKKLSFKYLNHKLRKNLKDEVPRWIVLLVDLYITVNTFLLTFMLLKLLNIGPKTRLYDVVIYQVPIVLICALTAFLATSSYRGVIRHTGFRDVINVLITNVAYLILLSSFYWLILNTTVKPQFIFGKSVILVHFLFNVLLMIFLRILYKGIYEYYVVGGRVNKKVMIYGAGESGVITYKVLNKEEMGKTSVFGFIDDNPKKRKKKIDGLKIYNPNKLDSNFFRKNNISEIIISIQRLNSKEINDIIDRFSDTSVHLKKVPPVSKWLNGDLSPKQIKSLNIDDFLGRDPIQLENNEILNEVNGKTILITGAAGSIGSEITRQLMAYPVKKLVLLDQAESALFDLQQSCENKNCSFIVGDVRNKDKMKMIFKAFQPDIVFHAAAYKHVPLMEENPYEAISANVKGTKIVADLSVESEVDKFVMISTDKAVNPTSVMGATKRIAELYVTHLNLSGKTKFIVTRFGNVLGSNGSVIPIFKRQIADGGPLTVTSPEITRYFMTISEACQLVLEAAAIGSGGEVFVFDMGEPIKIFDLAKKIIRLSGLKYPDDINIEIVGLRPGEKLHEELLTSNEICVDTHHPKIQIAKVEQKKVTLIDKINELARLEIDDNNLKNEKFVLIAKLVEIIPEFTTDNNLFDIDSISTIAPTKN
ncbi:MAG: nucleoside-diphosphate sugar epimerase/dehydratase [Weeksellaceae bacterium]|mgnify:CR=1 FL=1|nr:nucleoside-diphosphate sugar epimerase/dehydratase [Weeksellaceae bacterium]